MARPEYLACVLCGGHQPYEPFAPAVCKQCGSRWLESHYDFKAFKRELLRGLPGRPLNMWRYQDILPLEDPRAGSLARGRDAAVALAAIRARPWSSSRLH
jgi:threonine synthase